MNEYETIFQMVLDWLFWFFIGTLSAYAFISVWEYFNGTQEKD